MKAVHLLQIRPSAQLEGTPTIPLSSIRVHAVVHGHAAKDRQTHTHRHNHTDNHDHYTFRVVYSLREM